jgi:hypothetical protein
VNKDEILERFLISANQEIENKLKVYKRGTSMIDIKPWKKKKEKNTNHTDADDFVEESPTSKSIDVIIWPDDEEKKVSEIEKKNTKKLFMSG